MRNETIEMKIKGLFPEMKKEKTEFSCFFSLKLCMFFFNPVICSKPKIVNTIVAMTGDKM